MADVYIVDDGSTDATAVSIEQIFPEAHLICGSGDLFWAGGMRLAWESASRERYDAFLWLNDDVQLDEDALDRILYWSDTFGGQCIVGGSTRDCDTSEVTYSGMNRSLKNGWAFKRADPDPVNAIKVDVLNGNFLLVTAKIFKRVGNIAPDLVHNGGDFDYCLRAGKAGFTSMLIPGSIGTCKSNPPRRKVKGPTGLRRILSKKEMPLKVGRVIYREHAGVLWPIWLLSSYVKAFMFGF